MQPIVSVIPVDSYRGPAINVSYKRANGEAAFAHCTTETALPASVRPQLTTLTEDDLRSLERRMHYAERAEQRNDRIAARVLAASAQAQAAVEQRNARLRQRAARHAKVDGEVRVKQIQESYRTTGMR